MTSARVHLADPTSTALDLRHAVCGHFAVNTTNDPGRVTCRLCMRVMKREREAIPEYVDDRWFLEQTQKPLPMANLTRAQQLLWRHVFEGCARVISESEERVALAPASGVRAPFSSVSDALCKLVVTRLDGYASPSVGDPDRIKRLTSAKGEYAPPVGAFTSRAQGQAELAAEAYRALAHAYPGPWLAPSVTVDSCRQILILRIVGGRTRPEIAHDFLETRGIALSQKTVGRITSFGFGRMFEWLTERGLIPAASGRVVRPEDSEGESVAVKQCTDSDLFGWDEIAEFMDESLSTVQAWARDRGMPVRRFMGRRVEATREELRAWRARHTERPPAA